MAVETSPSLTSTSHTLTAAPIMAPAHATTNGDMLALLESLLPANRHAFLQPNAAIPNESLNLVKDTLEAFAAAVGEQQEQRLKESRKRKRGGDKGDVEVLKLRKVYVDGFETGQVWQQAKKIIGGVLKFSEAALDELEERGEVVNGVDEEGEPKSLTFGEDGFEVGSDGDEEEDGESDLLDFEAEGSSSDDEEDEEGLEDELEEDEDEIDIDGQDDYDEEEDDEEEKEYVEDPNGLNDGFFSIDDFNKQTQWFEDQDARGNPTTDQASDEGDGHWAATPLPHPKATPSQRSANQKTTSNCRKTTMKTTGRLSETWISMPPRGTAKTRPWTRTPKTMMTGTMRMQSTTRTSLRRRPEKTSGVSPRSRSSLRPRSPPRATSSVPWPMSAATSLTTSRRMRTRMMRCQTCLLEIPNRGAQRTNGNKPSSPTKSANSRPPRLPSGNGPCLVRPRPWTNP